MALRTGAFRVKLLVNRCNFHKFPSFVGVRSLSDNVSSKPVTSNTPESTGDHLIYTQEHFALKDSLRKVCKIASITTSVDLQQQRYFVLFSMCHLDNLLATLAIKPRYYLAQLRSHNWPKKKKNKVGERSVVLDSSVESLHLLRYTSDEFEPCFEVTANIYGSVFVFYRTNTLIYFNMQHLVCVSFSSTLHIYVALDSRQYCFFRFFFNFSILCNEYINFRCGQL